MEKCCCQFKDIDDLSGLVEGNDLRWPLEEPHNWLEGVVSPKPDPTSSPSARGIAEALIVWSGGDKFTDMGWTLLEELDQFGPICAQGPDMFRDIDIFGGLDGALVEEDIKLSQ